MVNIMAVVMVLVEYRCIVLCPILGHAAWPRTCPCNVPTIGTEDAIRKCIPGSHASLPRVTAWHRPNNTCISVRTPEAHIVRVVN